jgi:hypothetical protein
MGEYLKDYENELRLRNYSENTISCYLSLTKLFLSKFLME